MNKNNKSDLKKIAEQLVNLSVLEISDLNQILKEDYGIEVSLASPPVATAPATTETDKDVAASKEQYNVILKDGGEQKVAVIKAIKDLLEIPLGEAKTLVESTPKALQENVAQDKANEIKAKLEEVGAVIELT